MMKCERCSLLIKDEETYQYHGKVLCEDCYMYVTNASKACNPMAVSSALSVRKQLGRSGKTSLTALQKQIYTVIEQRGQLPKTNY
jgi:late competence protein required for DNA uptake (superfamily II DNA/RNA helicase)